MRFVTWNIRSLNKTGLLESEERELAKCNLDIVGVQVRLDNGDTELIGNYTFFSG
jgi:hypothetical protein